MNSTALFIRATLLMLKWMLTAAGVAVVIWFGYTYVPPKVLIGFSVFIFVILVWLLALSQVVWEENK